MRTCIGLLAGVMTLILASCSSGRAQRRPYLVLENLDYAAQHAARGEKEEAAQLYQVVLLADPSNEKARAGLAELGTHDVSIMQPTALGKNRVNRVTRESRSLWFVMYPVNRVLDFLDVVSFHVGLEGGVCAEAHATRAIQAGLGASGGMQVGWWQKRELAVGSAHQTGLALGPFSLEGEGCTRAGTLGARNSNYSVVGFNRPSDLVYQRHRDYWGIGGRATALLVGAEVEFHPVELADAIAGIFFIDFLRDDIGRTRSLELKRNELDAMEDLLGTLTPAELRMRLRGRANPSG